MPRKSNPQRKLDLLDEVVDYLTREGLASLSLRPLAQALGTSTYTLTYQFGSKDELIDAAIGEAERRQREQLARISQSDPAAYVDGLWDLIDGETGEQWVTLLLEIVIVAARGRDVHQAFEGAIIRDRVERLASGLRQQGLDPEVAASQATVLHAVVLGLSVDLLATQDRDRVAEAIGRVRERLQARQPVI